MVEMDDRYNFKAIEKKWQKKWDDKKAYKVEIDKNKEKFYALVEFPFPSGAGLHVGHPRSYTALDIVARKKRMEGLNVLYPMGFDAFGLPAENYAIKTGTHPRVSTEQNIQNFTRQLKALGMSFDWDRVIDTSSPEYYKWTQWMFIKLFEKGLAYKDKIAINWCPSCKTGLASEEVVNGCCDRCGGQVVKKDKEQWMVAITKYADRLIDDLEEINFIDRVKTSQINWIGRSEGAELDFILTDEDGNQIEDKKLTVFTTRPDTSFGVTYMVLAPEHPYIQELKTMFNNNGEIDNYVLEASKKSDLDREIAAANQKTGIELKGIKAKNPYNGELIPVFISDYVLMGYGTGAIMAVPAHDQRDYDFAKTFNLPITQVLAGGDIEESAHEGEGEHINSDFLDGMNKEDAIKAAVKFAEDNKIGTSKINFKLRDWVFSRQRYWGEPIPMVYCKKCGWKPIPETELPLKLPEVDDYHPNDEGESPLSKATEWLKTTCPCCGGEARRETDTMPNWAGSSWYFLRYCDPKNSEEFASKEALDYWMDVDWYNGGMEHTTLHLLYSRFWHKFLHDCGLVSSKEPYMKRTSHGMILAENGEKMSKSRGNVVNPDDIVEEYGADTFRLYEMFIGPFDQAAAWSTESLNGVFRFANKIYSLTKKLDKSAKASTKDIQQMHKTILEVSSRIDSMKFNTAVSSLMAYTNYLSSLEKVPTEPFETLIKLICPFTPHLSEEIWEKLGYSDFAIMSEWPVGDEKLAQENEVTIAVQVKGKVRGTLTIAKDTDTTEVEKQALELESVKKHIGDSQIRKVIVVPNRIVNIVI
jgi:leucyl-tRNA synthetase